MSSSASRTPHTDERPRVLFAEDDPDQAELLRLCFARSPLCEATLVEDGHAAVMAARAACEAGRPFLLYVLDFDLPGIKGVTAAQQIHEFDEGGCVVLLTASNDATLMPRSRAHGVADIWLKPLAYDNLPERVAGALAVARRGTRR